MELPTSLPGRVYLLAYDREPRRCDVGDRVYFEFTLRAAMLTDLYVTGHVEDKGGRPYRTSSVERLDDPLLRAMLDQIGADGRKDWAKVIADRRTPTARLVRDQLELTGGLCVQRRMFGMSGRPRLAGYDDASLGHLVDQVAEALHNAIDGLPADPRSLAAGLLAVLGQLPTISTRAESSRHRQRLLELTFAAIEPIAEYTRQS
jgi:Golgi phosphoprotein 3 (GPP34)